MLRTLIFFLALTPFLAMLALGAGQLPGMLGEPALLAALFRTLLLAEVAVPLALLLAVPAALANVGVSVFRRRLTLGLAALPLVLPPLWVAGGLEALADRSGVQGAHLAALMIAHTAPAAAVAYLLMTQMSQGIDARLREAALLSGAGPWRALALAGGGRVRHGIAVAAAGAFIAAIGYGLADRLLEAQSHPTLGGLLAIFLRDGGGQAPGAALLLALLCLAPLGLVLALGALTARP